MRRIIAAIDLGIDFLAAVTGQRPKPGFWTTVERVIVAIAAVGLVAVLAVLVAVAVMP